MAFYCEYTEISPPLSVDQSSGRSPVSPGFPQPLRFTPEGGPGKLRPVSIKIIQDVYVFTLLSTFNDDKTIMTQWV